MSSLPSQKIHLPEGQTFSITPVSAGFFFRAHSLTTRTTTHPHHDSIGWTVALHTESVPSPNRVPGDGADPALRHRPLPAPTVRSDSLFISSISQLTDAPVASSPRQVAMMLWVTLHWYFHQQPPPDTRLSTLLRPASQATPEGGRPRGDWRVGVRREGVLCRDLLLSQLERMGLVSGEGKGVNDLFVSQRAFWQMPARLFLTSSEASYTGEESSSANGGSVPCEPRLQTYYPPPPLQYAMTDNHVRHPLRPRRPRDGEVFYSRFVPSAGQYLSFRVASSCEQPLQYSGPSTLGPEKPEGHPAGSGVETLLSLSDNGLLKRWMNDSTRVSAFWGTYPGPQFLQSNLASRHSFPVIGLWDGVPFGYFEIYWVKEDILGRYLANVDDFDRGFHVLVGEEWARGRVQGWLSSLVHCVFTADLRTMGVCIEPRVDNVRFIKHLETAGFCKETEVSFPHKQSWIGRLRRGDWTGPAL